MYFSSSRLLSSPLTAPLRTLQYYFGIGSEGSMFIIFIIIAFTRSSPRCRLETKGMGSGVIWPRLVAGSGGMTKKKTESHWALDLMCRFIIAKPCLIDASATVLPFHSQSSPLYPSYTHIWCWRSPSSTQWQLYAIMMGFHILICALSLKTSHRLHLCGVEILMLIYLACLSE